MESQEVDLLEKQRQRRRRVARMRKAILIGIATLICALIAVLVFLIIKTVKLEKQVDGLTQQVEVLAQKKAEEDASIAMEQYLSTQEVTPLEVSGDASGDAYGTTYSQKIYLTFDDGPSDYTEEILDVLDAHNVKATFFVIGKTDEASLAMYREIVDRGHTLAMHSYTHKYSQIYNSVADFEEDLEKEIDLLTEATGQRPWLYRFPGGSSNTVGRVNIRDLIDCLQEHDISYCDWNIYTGDATNNSFTSDQFMANVEKDIGKYDNAVILMHDTNGKKVTRETLDELLTTLEQRDAAILPITQDSILVQHVSAQ